MKLNERSVAHYATCSSPPDKTGFLWKKGERNPAYQRRWCVLKGNLLFYFEERESREPLGAVVLEGCTVELCDCESEEFAFALRFDCSRARVYKLAADSHAAMESWVKALSRATFDYMRLLVCELERQLEDARLSQQNKIKTRKAQGGSGGRSKAGVSGSLGSSGAPGPEPGGSSEEGFLSLVPGRESGVSWNKPAGVCNGLSEGCVPGISWEAEGRGDSVRPPPVPPRRKPPTGSLPSLETLEASETPRTSCFLKLHHCYGKEVAELRVEWLQSQ
ncbi:sesquipedalian-1 [Hoplias malabaricus]|uniref:sesquipedalian-1-like n=1 Tax=Hoplias malabaricus TaxID=27720 RepID=UPI0034630989